MKSWDDLTDDERKEWGLWAAKAMKTLPPDERDELISESDNVIDARERFLFRMRQVRLMRAYRKPQQPRGAA